MTPTKNRSRYARGKLFTPQLDGDGQMQNYWLPSRDDQVVVSTLSTSDSHLPQIIEEAISLTGMLLTSSQIIPRIQDVGRSGGEQVPSVIWHGHGEGKQSSNQPNFEDPPTNVQSTGYVGTRSRVSELLGYRHGSTVDLWSHQRQLKRWTLPQLNAMTDVEVEESFAGLTVGIQPTRHTVFLVNDDPIPEVISSEDVDQWILPHPVVSAPEITDQMSRQFMEMDGMLARFSDLPENWNSYGGSPISAGAITEARRILTAAIKLRLPTPWVAPGGDAGIGIQWDTNRAELYIDIVPGEETTYVLTPKEGDLSENDGVLTMANLAGVLNQLAESTT